MSRKGQHYQNDSWATEKIENRGMARNPPGRLPASASRLPGRGASHERYRRADVNRVPSPAN